MNKTTLTILFSALSASLLSTAVQAADTNLASWDDWDTYASAAFTADNSLTGISATISGTDSNRRNTSFGSDDGTFGTSITGASESTAGLLINSSNLTLTIDLTNNTGSDYTLAGFYFDFAPRSGSGKGSNDFKLTYGAVDLEEQTDLSYWITGGTTNAVSAYPGYDVNLISSSIVLADSETVSFTLEFSGYDNASVSSVLDNVLVTGTTAIPEPSTYAILSGMLAFACVGIRRRRA
jgi:hypothetical protein